MWSVHFALTSACVNSWGDPIMMSRRLHSLARTRPIAGYNEVCGTIRLSDSVTVNNATCSVVAEWRRCRRSFIRDSLYRSAPISCCTFFRFSTRRRFNAPIGAMRRKARRNKVVTECCQDRYARSEVSTRFMVTSGEVN